MCRIKVKKALTDLVHKSLKPNVSSVDLSTGVAMLTKDADISAVTKLIKGGNEKYDAKIITYTKSSDNDLPGYVTINPSEGMIDVYYPMFEAWEAKQSEGSKKNLGETLETLVSKSKEEIFNTTNPVTLNNTYEAVDYDSAGILFNDKTSGVKVDNVLKNIYDYYQSTHPDLKDVLARIELLGNYAKPTVKFVSSSQLKSNDTLMQYDANNNEIQLARDRMDSESVHYVAESFLHEVVHSVTVNTLRGDSLESKLLNARISGLYSDYKSKGEDKYGLTSKEEFVAEAFTSSDFQDYIKTLDSSSSPESLWDKFVSFIKNILGINSNNFDNVISSIVDVIKSEKGISNEVPNAVFETKTKDGKEFKRVDLSTYEAKVENLYSKLQNSIKAQAAQLKGVRYNTKGVLGDLKRDNIKIAELLERNEEVNKIKGILHYINSIDYSLNMLKGAMSKPNITKDDMQNILSNYKKYHSYYSAIDDIKGLYDSVIKDPTQENALGSKKVLQKLENLTSSYKQIDKSFDVISKLFFKEHLNNIKYFPKVEANWKEKLTKEYETLYKGNTIKLKDNLNKKNWVNKKLIEAKEEIDNDVNTAINDLVDSPSFDINYFTQNFLSALETNSDIVQMTQVILSEIRNSIIEEVNPIHLELSNLHKKLTKAMGTSNPKDLYKNMIDVDPNGNTYFKGEYKAELHTKIIELENAISTLSYYGAKAEDLRDAEMDEKAAKLQNRIVELQEEIFTKEGKNRKIKEKYKTNINSLSKVEKESLEYIHELLKQSTKNTHGFNSLTPSYAGAQFYKLPSVTKSDLERALGGDAKGIFKDKIKDMTTLRVDDVGYEKADAAGNIIKEIPVHFRGEIDPKNQSLDLFGMMALESQNSIAFKHKKDKEIVLNAILDTAKGKKYYKTKGLSNTPLLNKFLKKNNQLLTSEEDSANSKTVQRIEGLLESSLYDITKKAQGTIAGMDKQKLVGLINGYTGMIGMSLNYHSGVANLAGGYAQFLMSAITKDTITLKSLRKAGSIYRKHSMDNLKDTSKTFDDSFTNQINKMFDVFGGFQIGKTDFIKDNTWRSFANIHSLQMFNAMGEHQMQSVITMSILEEIKALDKDGNFMTKAGTVTNNEQDAASLLDMLEKDKKGLLKMNDNVVFSEHSNLTKWNDGGKVQVQQLIKHKVFKLLGNYDDNMQPEVMKTAQGRLLMMYRRYFVPMYMNRFRGIGTAGKESKDLEDYDKYFSYGSKRFEEGIYVTTIRYIKNGLIPALKAGRLRMVTQEWENLTEYERANIYKTIVEGGLALLVGILSGIVASIDDDDEALMFFAYILRRTESELNQYRKPSEFQRIIKSPFAGMRSINNVINTLERSIYFTEWGETYQSGNNKGDLKVLRAWEKLVPIFGRNTSNKDKLEFLNSSMFSGS